MPNEPSVKDKTRKGTLSKEVKDFLIELRAKVKKDDEDRANWKLKQVVASNQRMGVKRYSNFPYPGAPDIPLPETDKLIKKSVPNLVLSAWAPKKMCIVRIKQGVQETPSLKAKAQRAELGMNMLLRSPELGFFRKLCLAADFAKQNGFCIFRVIESFRSRIVHKVIDLDDYEDTQIAALKQMSKEEKKAFLADRYNFDLEDDDDINTINDIIKQFSSGEKVIEFDVEEVYNLPNVEVPLPSKIIVPPYTTEINKANRITYEYFLTKEQLEDKMDKGIFLKKDIDNLSFSQGSKETSDLVESQKGRNEGVSDSSSQHDLFRIHETFCWYKPAKTASAQRWVFTTLADVYGPEEALLQRIPFPFEFEGTQYEKYDNEIKDPRYYSSRGVPEQIRAIQEILERCINNMIIRDEMNNTPMWEVLDTSDIMDAHIRFVPGEKIPVKQVGAEIKRLNEPSTVDISGERMMQILKAYAEEYLGNVDQLFRNATNMGGGKTLGEIREGIRQTAGPLNLEVINFNDTLSRVYKKLFEIMKERLGEDLWVEGVQITREDFNFPADIRSNGTLEVSDKDLATWKAHQRLSVIAQMVGAGVANQEDLYNAASDWLEKDGVRDPDRFLTHPAEIMQTKAAQLQEAILRSQAQLQALTEEIQSGEKQLSRLRKKGQKEVKQTEGELEALDELSVG